MHELLHPLKEQWDSIFINFITRLPRVNSHNGILVIIGHFSKYVIFLPTRTQYKVKETAELFLQNVVKLWGILQSIISDRDSHFIRQFQTSLFTLLMTQLNFSTTFHLQTNSQIEQVNNTRAISPPLHIHQTRQLDKSPITLTIAQPRVTHHLSWFSASSPYPPWRWPNNAIRASCRWHINMHNIMKICCTMCKKPSPTPQDK